MHCPKALSFPILWLHHAWPKEHFTLDTKPHSSCSTRQVSSTPAARARISLTANNPMPAAHAHAQRGKHTHTHHASQCIDTAGDQTKLACALGAPVGMNLGKTRGHEYDVVCIE